MIKLLVLVSNILIVALFIYSKLLPYKERLNPNYKKIFNFFNQLFSPIFNFFKTIIKPFQVGNGLFVDMSQVVLLLIFLLFLNLS